MPNRTKVLFLSLRLVDLVSCLFIFLLLWSVNLSEIHETLPYYTHLWNNCLEWYRTVIESHSLKILGKILIPQNPENCEFQPPKIFCCSLSALNPSKLLTLYCYQYLDFSLLFSSLSRSISVTNASLTEYFSIIPLSSFCFKRRCKHSA